MLVTSGVVLDSWRSGDKLILLAHEDGILALRALTVVQPPLTVLSITTEISWGIVIARAKLASPTGSHRVEDKVSNIEVIVCLMALVLASLDSSLGNFAASLVSLNHTLDNYEELLACILD